MDFRVWSVGWKGEGGRMVSRLILVFLLCTSLHTPGVGAALGPVSIHSKEKQLVKELLDRYNSQGKEGRPVVNTSDVVVVRFGLSLVQILDVDEMDQILKTNIWYQYEWRDELLTWNPSSYDNISDVRLPSDKIWLPDIVLYNFADERLKEQRNALVVTSSSGDLLWMPQAILRSSCSFNTLFFPFDEQFCVLKFGSWSYSGFKLDIHFLTNRTSFDLSDYIVNTEWAITQNTAKRMNIFLAFFVLLLLLAESTPKAASSIPLIGVYFCLNMVMITMSTVLSCVVANMFFRGVRINRAPHCLRVVMIDCIARVLCLRSKITDPDYSTSSYKAHGWGANTGRVGGHPKDGSHPKNQYPYSDIHFTQVKLLDNGAEKSRTTTTPPAHPGGSGGSEIGEEGGCYQTEDFCPSSVPLLGEVRAIREILEKVRDKKTKLEEKERYVREWRVIACVTDRVIFIAYLCVNFVGLLVIFMWHFNHQDNGHNL